MSIAPLSQLAASTPLRIIPFGDSITANNSFVNGDGVWTQGNGYAENSIRKAGPRFQFVRNAGVPGNTTTQMLARIQTDVLAYSPDAVLLLGGTNDILSGMANSAYTTLFNNLEAMILKILRSGALPILVTPPAKNGAPAETRYAQVFYYMLAQYYKLPLLDMYRLTVDPLTGNYISSYSGDGTHPNQTAIQAISDAFGAQLVNLNSMFAGPYLAAYGETAAGQPANLIPNGTFAHITTPPTPDYWTINSTNASYTTPAASQPFTGNTFDYVKTASGLVYALTGYISGGFAAGDTLVFSGQVTASGLTPATAGGFSAGLSYGGAQVGAVWANSVNGTHDFSQEFTAVTGMLSGSLTPVLLAQDVGTYTVNNLTLWNKSAAQAIWAPGQQA